jgi:hypothetical protein
MIDWDIVFNWKVWQVLKWIIGLIILTIIIIGILYHTIYK